MGDNSYFPAKCIKFPDFSILSQKSTKEMEDFPCEKK